MNDRNTVKEKAKNTKLGVRILSGAVLSLISVATILPGGYWLLAFNIFISMVGLMEFMRAAKVHRSSMAICAYVANAAIYVCVVTDASKYIVAIIMLYLIMLFALLVIKYPKYDAKQTLMAFSGLSYVGLGLSFLYRTRMLPTAGIYIVWLIFICSWISDSGAYLAGICFGKHKAFPVLSPKKSVEGCIGGVISSVLVGVIYILILKHGYDIAFLQTWEVVVICLAGSVISQIGDLAASAFKRYFEIKDYGKIIPGHGGIMDRYDSVIFVAPLVYYLCDLFI